MKRKSAPVGKGKFKRSASERGKMGGRPSKALDLKAREFILACIGGEDGVKAIIMAAFKKAKAGSPKHQELLLNYLLGRPVESVKLNLSGDKVLPSAPVVKIIADHLRLERLKDDVEASPIISEDRIAEMESILNKEI